MSRWTPIFTFLFGIFIGFSINSFRTTSPSKVNGIVVLATTLNVRDRPSTSAKILTTMKRGDPVRIVKRQGQWTQIIARPGTAWVHSSFIGSAKDIRRAIEEGEKQKKAEEERLYKRERAEAKRQRKLKEEAYKQKQSSNRVALFKQWSKEIEYGCRSRAAIFRKSWLSRLQKVRLHKVYAFSQKLSA